MARFSSRFSYPEIRIRHLLNIHQNSKHSGHALQHAPVNFSTFDFQHLPNLSNTQHFNIPTSDLYSAIHTDCNTFPISNTYPVSTFNFQYLPNLSNIQPFNISTSDLYFTIHTDCNTFQISNTSTLKLSTFNFQTCKLITSDPPTFNLSTFNTYLIPTS